MVQHYSILLLVTALLAYPNDALEHRTYDIKDAEDGERGVSMSAVDMLTSSLKATIPNSQLETFLKHGVSTDDVFKLLMLDNVANTVLANPKLNAWITYMKHFNNQNSSKKTSLVTTIIAHYGDDGLAKIIESAKKVSNTERIAKILQFEQLQRWIHQGQSLDDVFVLLKLDEVGDQLFAQPQFLTWVKYFGDFKETDLENEECKYASTEKIAIQIQAEQTKLWFKNEKSPSDVFKLLKLGEERKSLFTSPLFNSWLKYLDEFNMLDPDAKAILAFSTLKNHYENDELAKMILAASKTPSTEKLAERMQSEQLREWYSSLKPPEFVFKALKLDKMGSKLFERSLSLFGKTTWSLSK